MRTLFYLANGLIAIDYILLGIYFATRFVLPTRGSRHWGTSIAMIAAAVFFFGCAHTHLDLTVWGAQDIIVDHWFTWWNVWSHVFQALGGLIFWMMAQFFLKIHVFDKFHYDRSTVRVDRLVAAAEIFRREREHRAE